MNNIYFNINENDFLQPYIYWLKSFDKLKKTATFSKNLIVKPS
jgi:hypothetical protein